MHALFVAEGTVDEIYVEHEGEVRTMGRLTERMHRVLLSLVAGVMLFVVSGLGVVLSSSPAGADGVSLGLIKSASTASYSAPGQVINYSYYVTNNDNAFSASNITITDDKIPSADITCPADGLAPLDSMTCTGSYTVTQADVDAGSITNNASASGNSPLGPVSSAGTNVTVNAVQTPSLALTKSSGTPSFSSPGQTIDYSYLVSNTGNVTVGGIYISDDHILSNSISCPITTLAPGASTTCTGSYTTTQSDVTNGSVTNNATASGVSPSSATVTSAVSSVTVNQVSTAPGAPTDLAAMPGNQSVSLNWTAPDDGGSPIVNYMIAYSSDGGNNWQGLDTNNGDTSYTVNGLTNGTNYLFTVEAQNNNGYGHESSQASATPATTAPSVPLNVTTTPGLNSITIGWSTPVSDGGSAITQYQVYGWQGPVAQGTPTLLCTVVGADATSCLQQNLNAGAPYTFTVVAENSVGQSQQSPAVTDYAYALPSAPSAPTATPGATNSGEIDLSWTAPYDGGSPLTEYIVEYQPTGSTSGWTTFSVAPGVTSTQITGLAGGMSYTFEVAAVNAGGVGAASGQTLSTAPVGYPSPPTDIKAVAGETTLHVSWTPGTTGGSPVTYTAAAYTHPPVAAAKGIGAGVRASLHPGATPACVTTADHCTITDLTPGTKYWVVLTASNAAGSVRTAATMATTKALPVTPIPPVRPVAKGNSIAAGGAGNGDNSLLLVSGIALLAVAGVAGAAEWRRRVDQD